MNVTTKQDKNGKYEDASSPGCSHDYYSPITVHA